ncbi:MAG: COR domain-containing protein [Candidatus Electrothrix aestuarii]|uniref:non-specific serine/threonine protein kinase n=1 Tax=Candidatus Electrothrix aestuarii TaxID=3062594 RepID=A0AAU8LU78_9BACT|nr:COR domain-containing protein [Candidatus Electrothrix aestuarii]
MKDKRLLNIIKKAKKKSLLNLSSRGLTELPPELFQLTNLIRLDLTNNELTSLPSEIAQLTNLEELKLRSNHLTTLPPEICCLTNLKRLELDQNELDEIPPEISLLPKLRWLDLSYNKLTKLPPEIGQLITNDAYIPLYDNPLTSPPSEIAEQGLQAIRQYFTSLQQEEQPLNQVKLLLIGEGAAGKTSLVKQLFGEDFDAHEDTTHGISIRNWKVEENGDTPLRVNIWDFGGQEIMHATHQFFLSRRSLYVLVLDGRRDERPEYWLRHIESFGGDSPVLVVLNKQDSNPSFQLNDPFLQAKYPAIRGFFRTSCADGRGIAEFRSALLHELAQVEMIGIRWPGSWFRVKERIEQLDRPYISSEEYSDLCAEAGISEPQSREVLVDFLHDLGAAVHFRDFVLKAMHVLDPVWVTEAVYKIINAEEVADARGTLGLNSLGTILPYRKDEKLSWPESTHVFILELMKKFELCWGLGEQAVLIPQLLPVAEPAFSFDYANALGFVLHYQDFLPPSVMPRFLVKRHGQIRKGLCWRTGVVLEDKESGTEAVVKADHEARRIYLWAGGPRRKEFLTFLWFSLRAINDSFEKLNVSELIPMPDQPSVTVNYNTMLTYTKKGIDVYIPDGSEKEYSVRELLGLVEPEGEDEMRQLMHKIEAHLDEKESATEAAVSLFELKPNIAGIGVNLNELFGRILGREKRKK